MGPASALFENRSPEERNLHSTCEDGPSNDFRIKRTASKLRVGGCWKDVESSFRGLDFVEAKAEGLWLRSCGINTSTSPGLFQYCAKVWLGSVARVFQQF